jgi:hypothetical protein
MKLISSLVTIFLFSLISFTVNAATGCLSNSTTYTYINSEGIDRNGVPSFYHRTEADRVASTSTYCVVNTGQGCYINSTRSGYSSSPGTIVVYNNVNNCPLDTYTTSLVIGFAILGFVLIKKHRTAFLVKSLSS